MISTTYQSFQPLLSDRKDLLTTNIAAKNELLKELLSLPVIGPDLLQELRVAPLSVNQVLYEQADKIEFLYFPLDAVVSGLAIMEDGTTIETSMVGCESVVGISTVLGSGLSRQWVWVTVAGNALQLDAKVLDKLVVQNEVALKALLRCYRLLLTQVSQRCVCNTRHTIMERLCCWLLMIHDRVGNNNLNLTQEMIASRIGARRAGITVAAGMLQAMKAIEYRRGHLQISDREVLERTVCECYNVMKNEWKFVTPPPQKLLTLFDLFALKNNRVTVEPLASLISTKGSENPVLACPGFGKVGAVTHIATHTQILYTSGVEYPFPPVGIVGAADGKNRRAFLCVLAPKSGANNWRLQISFLSGLSVLR